MRILRVLMEDFGKFHQKEIFFTDGINLIHGNNESGKTTLNRFIRAMLYGLVRGRGRSAKNDDYEHYLPWEGMGYRGLADVDMDGVTYRIRREFSSAKPSFSIIDLRTGVTVENPEGFLEERGLLSEAVFNSTVNTANLQRAPKERLAEEMGNYLTNMAASETEEIHLAEALKRLNIQYKELEKRLPKKELEQINIRRQEREVHKGTLRSLQRKLSDTESRIVHISNAEKNRQQEEKEYFRNLYKRYMRSVRRISCLYIVPLLLLLGVALFPSLLQWFLPIAIGSFLLIFFLAEAARNRARRAESGAQEEVPENEEEKQELIFLQRRLQWEIEREEEFLAEEESDFTREKILFEELKRTETEQAAVLLAKDTLEQLSKQVYESFGTEFCGKISELSKALTDGKYTKVLADREMHIRAVTKEKVLDTDILSTGTADQLSLALRLAATEVLDKEKQLPLFFDDCFFSYDDNRLAAALNLLKDTKRQCFIFSCSGREKELLDRLLVPYMDICL